MRRWGRLWIWLWGEEGVGTYRVVTLGIIRPVLRVSTRRMYGMMDKMLWCEEKGVSQWTARFRIHTTNTGKLIGRIHSIRISRECA